MTNTSDAIADSTEPEAAAIFKANTFIADAMGYTALPSAYKTAIWNVIDQTWAAGHVPTVGPPAAQFTDPVSWNLLGSWNAFTNTPTLESGVGTEDDMWNCIVGGIMVPDLDGRASWSEGANPLFKDGAWVHASWELYLDCTELEARVIYASQVAHALWLEHTQEFPWRITSYSLEECSGLFDPTVVYWSDWNTGSSPYLQFAGIAHYDVYGTYTLVTDSIFSGYTHRTPKQTVGEFLERCDLHGAYPSVHHNTATPSGMVLSPVQHFSTENEYSASDLHVSRRGCHTAAPLMAALARSINLPTRELHGIFNDDSLHHSMEFLSVRLPPKNYDIFLFIPYDNTPKGAILHHGDNIYSTHYEFMSGAQKLMPRGYFDDNVIGQTSANIDLNGYRMAWNLIAEQALEFWKDEYVEHGWQHIVDTFIEGGGVTDYETRQGTIDRIERDVKARNGEVVL